MNRINIQSVDLNLLPTFGGGLRSPQPGVAAEQVAALPSKLYWHASREADSAHTFLRNELSAAAARVVNHR